MTKVTNQALAAAARARDEDRFTAVCPKHGETEFYSSTVKCVMCKVARNAVTNGRAFEKRRTDPAARGAQREHTAAHGWRKVTKGNMTGWYGLDREVLRHLYATRRDGFELDHAIAKVSVDSEGIHVASGLHCYANVVETPKVVNRMKWTQFSPDTNRLQRPANREPGGAFSPEPTAHEWSLIEQARKLGTPVEVSLKALRDSLDAKAVEYERYTAELLVRLLSEVRA